MDWEFYISPSILKMGGKHFFLKKKNCVTIMWITKLFILNFRGGRERRKDWCCLYLSCDSISAMWRTYAVNFTRKLHSLKVQSQKQFTDFETLLQLDFFMPFFYLQFFFFHSLWNKLWSLHTHGWLAAFQLLRVNLSQQSYFPLYQGSAKLYIYAGHRSCCNPVFCS